MNIDVRFIHGPTTRYAETVLREGMAGSRNLMQGFQCGFGYWWEKGCI